MKIKKSVKINGIKFNIGYQSDVESDGYIFEMEKNGKLYGVLCVDEKNREVGFRTNVFANDEEIQAIKEAKEILKNQFSR